MNDMEYENSFKQLICANDQTATLAEISGSTTVFKYKVSSSGNMI